jgi:hypothetical protein
LKIEDSAKRQTLKRTLATSLAVIWLSGCTADDAPPAGTVDGPTTLIEPSAGAVDQQSLLPPVRAFANAVAAKDRDALVRSFASNGVVIDAGRRIEGADAIRRWATNESITGTLTLLQIVESSGNRQRLLTRFAPGGSGGFEAYYTFDVAEDRITQLDLQYA